MPPSLMLWANLGMILSGGAFFWVVWRYRMDRSYLLIASGFVISGLAWFLPSESGSALVAVAAGCCSVVGLVLLMITTWRQASIHE